MSLCNKVINSLKKEKNTNAKLDIEAYIEHLKINDIFISYEIENRLNRLSQRANEPMKLAVSGLFSSGKSTFLNAMLSDEILPSGNLPITSKITYLHYGKEPQLKLTYLDGREELASIESISKYVNQQSKEHIQTIDYITLYYPQEILKKIIFVDTPGFNSPNKMDDKTTEDILKNVDGIIWLTMISNAGKKSEIDVLEQYFKSYHQKSICIVNHKDEIDDDDEVEEFIEELKEDNNFAKYFAEIIPISALQALESRQKNQNELMQKLVREFSNTLEDKLLSHIEEQTILEAYQSIMKDDLVTFMQEHNRIKKSNKNENKSLLISSNIEKVFDYIDKNVAPQATETLDFSLKKEIKSINNEIIQHYDYLVEAIDELEQILQEFNSYQKVAIDDLNTIAKRESKKVIRDVKNLIKIVVAILVDGFVATEMEQFVPDGERTFFTDTPTGENVKYTAYLVDRDFIGTMLTEENSNFEKARDKLETSLDKLHEIMKNKIFEIEEALEKDILDWKKKYQNLQEFSPENIELQGIAMESFNIICNDFENQAIIFNKDTFLEIKQIYNSLCDVNVIYNAGVNSAYHFNEAENKPTLKDMTHNLNLYLNTNWIYNILNGEDSFIDREINTIKEILSEISTEKLSASKITKEEWENKKNLLII